MAAASNFARGYSKDTTSEALVWVWVQRLMSSWQLAGLDSAIVFGFDKVYECMSGHALGS